MITMRKLGKNASIKDPRTLKMSAYVVGDLPPPPPSTNLRSKRPSSYSKHVNDELGCCTISANAHSIETWTASSRGDMSAISDNDVREAYSAVSGYEPGKPETDNGASMLTVMKRWRSNGVGGHKIDAFVELDNHVPRMLKIACHMMGGIQVGLSLPNTASAQINAGLTWQGRPNPKKPDTTFNSWGGHAVYMIDYDVRFAWFVTWGQLQPATWEWVKHYADEFYVGLSLSDWIGPNGKSPSGFDADKLQRDLHKII